MPKKWFISHVSICHYDKNSDIEPVMIKKLLFHISK